MLVDVFLETGIGLFKSFFISNSVFDARLTVPLTYNGCVPSFWLPLVSTILTLPMVLLPVSKPIVQGVVYLVLLYQ